MASTAVEAGPSGPSTHPTPYIPRAPLVNQIDAENLDDGIAALLGDGVERTITRFHVRHHTPLELTQ